jgi:prolycopene isomerase
MLQARFIALPALCAALLVVVGCDGSSQAPDVRAEVPDGMEAAEPPPIEARTSATPGIPSATLEDGHPGWRKANCAACHELAHGGTLASECVVCHGPNGAPRRPAGHDTGACLQCHSQAHQGAGEAVLGDCAACHKFAPGDGCAAVVDTDVVVIGSGGGGLAAAAILAQAGRQVVVLESHSRVGGYMTNFRRGDYRFEVSLHAMGGFDQGGSTRHLFQRLGILDRVQPVKASFPYRTYYPDRTFDVPEGFDAYREALKADFPAEAEGIDALFALFAKTEEVMATFSELGYQGAIQKYSQDEPETVTRFLRLLNQTLTEALREYVSDQSLVAILAQLASYIGEAPEDLSALYYIVMWNAYHRWGFYNFVGGSQSVSEALAAVIEGHGGTIRLNTPATRIVVEEGRAVEVRTAEDACYRPGWVVSNANAPATVDLVGRDNLPSDYLAKVDAMRVGRPIVVVYLGVDHDYTPEFQGTHEWMIQDGYDTAALYEQLKGCEPGHSLLLVANYSVVDPTAAPAGKNVISITSTMDDACHGDWQWGDPEAYKEQKQAVAAAFIAHLEPYLPGLRQHLEVMEVAAPQTLRGFTGNPRGTIYGWSHTPEQSTVRRLPQETPVENLLLAGMWTFPGAGQAAVLQSGETAAELILAAQASH